MSMVNTVASAETRILPKHLKRLEAESIEIMREVVAEFKNPVMLYSIGKDSSVMLHVAMKAFYPAPLPFPVMHVDTTWKFREMIAFRDETAHRLGLNLPSAAPAETRRRAEPKNASSRFAPKVMLGTREISDRNYGTCSTPEFGPARRFECSRCRTGPR